MSYAKVCLRCDEPFTAKRESARFCSDKCRGEWHTENNAAVQQEPGQRVEHALDDVRGLHEAHKGDWTAICREHARRTLLATGYLSAADFECLGVPDEHHNVPNAQIGGLASAGYMEAITFKRWPPEQKASRKSGKYWIYRITPKGKEKLAGVDRGKVGDDVDVASDSSGPESSVHPGVSSPPDGERCPSHGDPGALPEAPGSPPQLPGFEESAYERMRDAA